jgi:hypothetical protein
MNRKVKAKTYIFKNIELGEYCEPFESEEVPKVIPDQCVLYQVVEVLPGVVRDGFDDPCRYCDSLYISEKEASGVHLCSICKNHNKFIGRGLLVE